MSSTSIEALYSNIIVDLLECVRFAVVAHGKQTRKNGEGHYIVHPLEVAIILMREGGVRSPDTLKAAILHDVVEDTTTTLAQIESVFGKRVASIVAEVSDDRSLSASDRKRAQVEHIPHLSTEAKLVKFGDKISNLRSMTRGVPGDWSLLQAQGYALWCREAMSRVVDPNVGLERALAEVLSGTFPFQGGVRKMISDDANIDSKAYLESYYVHLEEQRKKKPTKSPALPPTEKKE
jgi:hypothetical protein